MRGATAVNTAAGDRGRTRRWALPWDPVTEGSPDPAATPRRRKLLAAIPLVAVVAFVVAGEVVARGRTLHVLNMTPTVATVTLGDAPAFEVRSGGRVEVPIAEGDHVAVVERLGRRAEVALPVRTSWLGRLVARPLFVLDVEGAAPLIVETALYGEGEAEPLPPRVLFGAQWIALEGVDVAFGPFPQQVESDARVITRTRVDVLPGEPADVLARFPRSTPRARRLEWAELRLGIDPTDEALLATYRDLLASEEERTRGIAFLERGLDRRPVVVAWHRAYQDQLRARGREDELATRYAALLAAEPTDAALLYLVGRLEPDARQAVVRYDQAIEADALCAFAWHGKAYVKLGQGAHDEALRCALEATRLRPHDQEMAALRDDARLALGRFQELRGELEAALLERPLSYNAQRRMLEVLVAADAVGVARERHAAFVKAAHAGAPAHAERLEALSAVALADLEGDPDRLVAAAAKLPASEPARAVHELAALLARGRVQEAAERALQPPLRNGPRFALLVSIGFARAGELDQARAWRARAAEWLSTGSGRERGVAALLRADRAPSVDDLDRIALPPVEAATLCAALADAWPDAAQWLRERSQRACHGRYFPAWYLRDVPR